MIGLDKCNGCCNAVDDLSTKMSISNKTKDINVKVFNIVTRLYEDNTLVKHISCDCKWKINSRRCNLNQKWNYDKCQCECKNYHTCTKDYSWNRSTCICENGKYLKSVANDSKIVCVEIINATDSVSTDFYNKKVSYKMDCFLLHTVWLAIILLFIIAVICYHYPEHRPKLKRNIAVLKI